jgi:hypothetical protein
MHMPDKSHVVSQQELQKKWQERCSSGNFSAGVLGVGTIRVFGRSGDTPVTFPRIESLTALDQLADDERWALDTAQEMITAAQARQRPVMATQPPRAGAAPNPTPMRTFDPKTENILILSLTRGG